MLLTDFLKDGIGRLESIYPVKEARSIVIMLCESLLGTKNYTHIVEPEFEIPASKEDALRDAVFRLSKGEPIQYVVGSAEFCGLSFRVTKDVLIPRPETEMICRQAIKIGNMIHRSRIPYGRNAKPVRVLDLCTGSGCIAWIAALSIPCAKVTAVDISDSALEVARNQEFSVKLKETGAEAPNFIQADVLGMPAGDIGGEYDLVLSNPPYIMESEKSDVRHNVLDYEPSIALFVPDDDPLLFYKAIADWSLRFLSKDGVGMTEINEILGRETESLFKKSGFSSTELVKDFYDKNRFIVYRK